MTIPDAFAHDVHLLPHEHEDLEGLFPAAVAAPAPDDHDPPDGDELERKGIEIGKEAVRATQAISGACTL